MTPAPYAMSVKAAAAHLEVSEQLIRDAINKGELPCKRLGETGKLIRVTRAALEEWFDGQPTQAAS